HPEPAVLVEGHGHRALDVGLGGDQLDAEAGGDVELLQGLLRREGTAHLGGFPRRLVGSRQQDQAEGQATAHDDGTRERSDWPGPRNRGTGDCRAYSRGNGRGDIRKAPVTQNAASARKFSENKKYLLAGRSVLDYPDLPYRQVRGAILNRSCA